MRTVRDCSEDPTLGPARPRPSAGGPFRTQSTRLSALSKRMPARHLGATEEEEATTRERIHHISWNGPGRYVRRVTGPFAGFATGAPATTPTRAQ